MIELQKKNNQIISCGGGVALRDENVAEMKKNGKVVLLTASPEVILERVKDNDDRPLLRGNKNTEFISKYDGTTPSKVRSGSRCCSEHRL